MECEVEYTDEFGIWWSGLTEDEQDYDEHLEELKKEGLTP